MFGGKFHNTERDNHQKSMIEVAKWTLGLYRQQPQELAPPQFFYPMPAKPLNYHQPIATWINHSTYLISYHGVNILTDPIFADRCSPVSWLGPKRLHPPAIALEALPEIHFVLISHDHYDHLCRESVKRLMQRFPKITWIVPLGVAKIMRRWGIVKIKELKWWEHHHIEGVNFPLSMTITAVPSQHFSGRKMWHANNTLWCGYVVELRSVLSEPKQFYFVGDTGYNSIDFKRIGDRMGPMDLALIPIGTYMPTAFMETIHIGPEQAVNIHRDVRSKLSLGMHWQTFKLSSEPIRQPPFDLYRAMRHNQLDPLSFLAVEPGVKINW
jgi:N-acyl-phosphatidylethanolamine-hydrolysing phospholipase D